MYQLNVFVHVLSAVIWVGGMLFVSLVVVPAVRHLPPKERSALMSALGRRFRVVGWTCIVLLVLTGLLNAGFRGVTWANFPTLVAATSFGQLLGAKVLLVGAMIALSAVHDFVIGPASTQAFQRADGADRARAERLRRQAAWLARLNALLALAVVALAVLLVRGLPA